MEKEVKREVRNKFMMSAVNTAMEYAIFQHEVDKLMEMYSKYHDDCDVSNDELKEDLAFIEKLLS